MEHKKKTSGYQFPSGPPFPSNGPLIHPQDNNTMQEFTDKIMGYEKPVSYTQERRHQGKI